MKKISSFWITILLVFSSFMVTFLGNISALNDAQNLSGIIWQSDGSNPSDITQFCVWVEHNSIWYRYPQTGWVYTNVSVDGLWWYSYVLPDPDHGIKWDDGDIYRIQINGEPWGDINDNTTSNGTGSSGDPFPTPYNPSIEANKNNTINYIAGGGFANEQQWDVRTIAQIDLLPTNITLNGLSPDPLGNPVPPSSQVSIIFNVTNLGSTDSGDFNVTLYNYSLTLGQNIGPPFAEFSLSSISPGGDSGELTAYWFSPAPPGEYYVNLTVDSDYEIPEFNEVNNRIILRFITGPDLNITNVLIWGSVPEDPFYIAPNEVVQIFATVENIGQSSTGSGFILALYNITGPSGSIIPGHQSFNHSIGTLDIGNSAIRSWDWPAPSTEGDYYVNITADYGDNILEADELNNHFTIHFNVTKIPVTRINHTNPYYILPFQAFWYINISTEIYFMIAQEFFPPYYTWYRVIWANNGSEVKVWTNYTLGGSLPFTIPWGEGTYRIEFYSVDSVGAQEPIKNKIIVVDNSVPLTSINFQIPK